MVEIGEGVPKVKLVDTDMAQVSLPKASKGKTAVIAFFPGAFSGTCTTEMCTLRDSMEKLTSFNASLFAVSVDGPFANKAFKDAHSINFPILSDYRKKAVKKFGIELKDFAGLKGYVVAKRSVFIVNPDGTVKYKWVTDDPTVEPNYSEIESVLSGSTSN